MTLLEQSGDESATDVARRAGNQDALYDEDREFVTSFSVVIV